ncbi:hypothetical protein HanIR_Chr14g0694711 [Helianthus annuus]|nr:hypothetical protein HanIR_Chr14g0694711 [Helianthus annuus]
MGQNGFGSKRVNKKRGCFGSGRNRFGSERVSGRNRFRVELVKNVFLQRLYIKGQFCSVRNDTMPMKE